MYFLFVPVVMWIWLEKGWEMGLWKTLLCCIIIIISLKSYKTKIDIWNIWWWIIPLRWKCNIFSSHAWDQETQFQLSEGAVIYATGHILWRQQFTQTTVHRFVWNSSCQTISMCLQLPGVWLKRSFPWSFSGIDFYTPQGLRRKHRISLEHILPSQEMI